MTDNIPQDIIKLSFMLGITKLSDGEKTVLFSLLQEFIKIGHYEFDLELSHFYSPGEKTLVVNNLSVCEKSWFILRYTNLKQGLIRFYLKQQTGDVYKYTRIYVQNTETALDDESPEQIILCKITHKQTYDILAFDKKNEFDLTQVNTSIDKVNKIIMDTRNFVLEKASLPPIQSISVIPDKASVVIHTEQQLGGDSFNISVSSDSDDISISSDESSD